MDTNPLFTIALGLGSPWEVQRTEFDPAKRVLRVDSGNSGRGSWDEE